MTRFLKAALMVVMFPVMLGAQSGARGPLEGAWKVAEIVVTGAGASNTPNPQPGLFIFTRTHYSLMWAPGNQPRPLFKAEEPTNAEKTVAFDSCWQHRDLRSIGHYIDDSTDGGTVPELYGRCLHEIPISSRGKHANADAEVHGRKLSDWSASRTFVGTSQRDSLEAYASRVTHESPTRVARE